MSKRTSVLFKYDKELAAAFKKDCETFLDDYEQLNTLSFDDFARVWQFRNFSYIFGGQNYALLLKEFCENCFYITKKYIMFPRSLNTQIGAFYLLYGLYYKQPVKDWIKIRLTMEEYQKISDLMLEMKNRKQFDAVYIFSKMKKERVFVYVALRKPLGPEDRFIKNFEFYYDDTFSSAKTTSALHKFSNFVHSSELMEEFKKTNDRYHGLLQKYSEKHTSLAPLPSTIVEDLNEACSHFSSRHSIASAEIKSTVSKKLTDKRSIKQKAMKSKTAEYRAARSKTPFDKDISFYSN